MNATMATIVHIILLNGYWLNNIGKFEYIDKERKRQCLNFNVL